MQNIILDGGLDLTTARPATLPGLIRDCLNYEVGWQRGYTRIDGFERFDGRVSPSNTTGWYFQLQLIQVSGSPFMTPETMTWSNADGSGPAGTLISAEIGPTGFWEMFLVFQSGQHRPQLGDTLTGDKSGANFSTSGIWALDIKTFPEYYDTHEEYLYGLDGFASTMRDEVLPLPGGGTIVGLHYHEDQLYAIRDVAQITVPEGSEALLVPGMYVYNVRDEVGEVLAVNTDTRQVSISPVSANGFTLAAGESVSIALTVRFTDGVGTFNIGDTVLGATYGWSGETGFVDRRDGSWDVPFGSGGLGALGSAAFIDGPDSEGVLVGIGEIFDNTVVAASSMVIESVQFGSVQNVLVVEATSSQSEFATMWRSTDDGWERATSGRQIAFDNGTTDPSGSDIAYSTTFDGNLATLSTTREVSWNNPLTNVEGPPDDVTIWCNPFASSYSGYRNYSDMVDVRDFQAGIPDSHTVTGLELVFRTGNLTAASDVHLTASMLGEAVYYNAACPFAASIPAMVTTTAGGADATWGAELTPAKVNAQDFGFRFFATPDTQAASQPHVDSVQLTVYATAPALGGVYLYDTATGTDLGTISIESVVLESGAWDVPSPPPDIRPVPDPGLAAGYFRISDWTISSIPAGTELWTNPGGPAGIGAKIAETTSNISIPALPGSSLLEENNSKYQMISYNFFATEEKNAIYGCSGAGPAFWYDGTTLDFILTGVGATDGNTGAVGPGVVVTEDKPRHVAPHENRLALGYIWGEVYLSGPDPLDFSAATELAASFGFGDKITGLMPAPGKALAVFTESTTSVLIGAPTGFGLAALNGVEQQVVNHKVGAIEYTVQSMGNRPIFATFRGIETLETMDQYSDFFTAPLTYKVSPWLLERLQSTSGVEAVNRSAVASVVVRNKNQFRLFFADGYLLTLTFVGPEKEPQNTIQKYWFDGDQNKYARCYATASGVSSSGQDHAFFSVEERPDLPGQGVPTFGAEIGYVYELDRGRSFDGADIEANFSLTYYFGQARQGGPNPAVTKKFNVFHVHGLCPGTADLHVSRAMNYEYLDNPDQGHEPAPFYSGIQPPEAAATPKYSKGRLHGRGFAVTMNFSHTSSIEFPHTLQMVTFLNDTELKPDR